MEKIFLIVALVFFAVWASPDGFFEKYAAKLLGVVAPQASCKMECDIRANFQTKKGCWRNDTMEGNRCFAAIYPTQQACWKRCEQLFK